MLVLRPRVVTTVAVLVLLGKRASADDHTTANHRARAQELFESGLADVAAGRYASACPKFAASHAADPKTTTLLNLGSCYEDLGKTASAWGAFREAQGLARKAGREDLETAARTKAEAVAPRLVRLTIVVAEPNRAPGLVVSLDGSKLTTAEWGVGIPVDDGDHELAAEAPGRKPWRDRVAVRGMSRSVDVPSLAPAPSLGGAAPSSVSWWTPMRTAGVGLAGAGAASILAGLVVAFIAKSDYDDARAQCRATDDCPGGAVRSGDSARSLATGGTVAGISGAVVGAVGGALILLGAPSERTTNTGSRAHASLGFGPASVGVVGKW